LYNYIKPKSLAIEPFYYDFSSDEGKKIMYPGSFFDIVETYDYADMKYNWYSMPYYNLTVTTNGKQIIIPDSYFTNNGTTRSNNDSSVANGIFAKHVDKTDEYINYTGAAIILACPNIHRINLKNFILSKGNIPTNFNLTDTDIATFKDTYNVLYKINFWYSAIKCGLYDNSIIGEKLDNNTTGFDYVKYIYNPNRYNDTINEDQYYYNYINSYTNFITSKLGSDYYSLNNNMALINDIYNDDISKLNLKYINEMYPYEKLRSDSKPKPYATYLEKINTDKAYDFKINVNAASRLIMKTYIATHSATTPGVSEPDPDYNKIFKNTSFQSSVNPGDSNDMNGIKSGLTDFFNNFYILNALYALYAERYYYVDSKYYNMSDASKSTLSFDEKTGKFIGGETFTTTYEEWLTTIGISTKEPKANASAYINSEGTEFMGNGDNFSLYYYKNSPYLNGEVIKKSYENPNDGIDNYVDPLFPISKLYRGLTYVDAINIIDENNLKNQLTQERKDVKANVDKANAKRLADIAASARNIKNIKINMAIREKMATFVYDNFVTKNDYWTADSVSLGRTMPDQNIIDPYTKFKVNDDSGDSVDLNFGSYETNISMAMINSFYRLTNYSDRDNPGDRGFDNAQGDSFAVRLENQRFYFTYHNFDLDWQRDQFGTPNVIAPKVKVNERDELSPIWDWMGLGGANIGTKDYNPRSTEEWTKKTLKEVAKKLMQSPSGLGYTVQWYNDVIRYGLSDTVAANIGRQMTNATYKSKGDTIITWAKAQVLKFQTNVKNDDWRYYWRYALINPASDGVSYSTNPELLSAVLQKERDNYKSLIDKPIQNYDLNLTIKNKYETAKNKYNELYTTFIPSLLKTTIDKLNNSITKINSFDVFMNSFTDLIIHNYKWEEITRTKSINKILDVNYGKSINKKYPDFTVNIFKNVVRNKSKGAKQDDEDTYNAVDIEILTPTLVYFEDYKGSLNTPSSSNDVYIDNNNDFLIYLKKKDNREILTMIQDFVKSDLIALKGEITDILLNMFNELYTSIETSTNNNAKTIMRTITTTIENTGTVFNQKNNGPDMLSVLIKFVDTVKNNKDKKWKVNGASMWTKSLDTFLKELEDKESILTYYKNNGLFTINPSLDSSEKLTKYLALEDKFNDGKTMNDRVNKMYESYYFSKKTDFYYKKNTDMYSYIYRHPKILMTYINVNSDGKTKSGFSIFDLGIILRYIFDYDIRKYIDGTEKYTNYNFPTLFQYDANNVLNIKEDADVLSDEIYNNLSINSKLNNFFNIIDEQYNGFNKAFPEINIPVDYFNFSKSETVLRKELDIILNKLTTNENDPIDIIKYSYTTYFISSVNCLCTMYTDDVCNIILPLYKHLNYTFTELIDNVYDFDSTEFNTIKNKIQNQTFLQDIIFKKFYERYTNLFKSLNNGDITQSASPGGSQSSPGENQKYDKSGTLIYLFNVHNFLLNLILRAFYYYNKYVEYKINKPYSKYILNRFDDSFKQTVDDNEHQFTQDNPYLVNRCNIFTDIAYMNSVVPFLIDALTLYRTKIIKCCYNHILVNMANIVYQLNDKSMYIYNSEDNNEYSQIEKGETLIKTMKLYENMLTTVKNGEIYIESAFYKLKIPGKLPGGDIDKTLDPVFKNLNGMFNKYLNSTFYIGNAKLYGCFDGNISNYYSSLGFSEFIDNKNNPTQGKESTLISYVNNKDANGNDTKYGAIVNCINDTLAHNKLISADATPGISAKNDPKLYDLVSIVPYNNSDSNKIATIDTYSCYAGKSSNFKKTKDVPKPTIGLSDLDKCSLKYLDSDGNKNKDFDNNLKSTTVIYKIDASNQNDSNEVSFLGCFKKSIPDMGIYNTLPNFIGNISGSSYSNPGELMGVIKRLVNNYNESFGTNYDIYGITTNVENTLELDVYAGNSKVDATYAQYAKNDGYQENCNIYFPGSDNYMIYQNKTTIADPCLTNEVNHVKNYTDLLTEYLNKNIKSQQETISEMGVDINLLQNLFPIKFSVSNISNSKDNASLSIDKEKSIEFDPNANSIRTCALNLLLKEGPPGIKGDPGISGEKGKNTKGLPGDIGNAGYWGDTKN
jgi:hypothetical protein